jgi:glucokinase
VRHGGNATVIAAEGGHADFAPVDAQEIAILNIMIKRFGRVSYERLLSGAGILSTYQSLAELAQREPAHRRPEDVYAAAISGTDTLAMRTLHVFCRVLGAFAGNLALTLGARGGVFIAGRLRSFLTPIPVYVVTAADIGLRGAANYLAQVEQLSILEGTSYEYDQP